MVQLSRGCVLVNESMHGHCKHSTPTLENIGGRMMASAGRGVYLNALQYTSLRCHLGVSAHLSIISSGLCIFIILSRCGNMSHRCDS